MNKNTMKLSRQNSLLVDGFHQKIAIILSIVAFFVSSTQFFGYSQDYHNYDRFFNLARIYINDVTNVHRFEPGFAYFSKILILMFSDNSTVYSVMVFLCVLFKINIMSRLSHGTMFFVMSIVLYLMRFFPLHELTQLRAAAAIVFLSFSFYCRVDRKYYWALFWGGVAFVFHYSSAIMLPFIFLPELKVRQLVIASILSFSFVTLFSDQIIGASAGYFSSIDSSLNSVIESDGLKPYSPILIPEYFILIFSVFNWYRITPVMRIVVSIEVFGLIIGIGLNDLQVLAVRSHELFIYFWIFYVAQSGACDKYIRVASIIFVVLMSLVGAYSFFYGDFFT